MRTAVLILTGAGLALASCEQGAPAIAVDGAWARATAAGQGQGAVYLRIANSGSGPDRLVAAQTDRAKQATLHHVSNEGGVHRMRAMKSVEVRGRSAVEFTPGGQHIMLSGLNQPLEAGSSFALILRFERSGARELVVAVREAGAAAHLEHER